MSRTVREIANYLGARLEGDANIRIAGLAAPEHARAGDLIYADSPRQFERAAQSAATCVLCTAEANLPGKSRIIVENPKLAFAKVAAWLLPPPRVANGVHPTAVVSPSAMLAAGVSLGAYVVIEDGAQIGARTQIGAFCFLGAGSHIGEDCILFPRVTLYAGARLGNRVILHSGTVIGSDGFGYVPGDGRHWKFPQIGGVQIADDVEIGANTTVDRGSLESTRIGPGVKIDNLVQIAHNVEIGEHSVIAAQTGISGSSVVGKNAVIGGQVGIADHCTIEDGAICGAQAGIPTGKTIRAGQVVWGTPARALEKFKEQYAWFARLPALAARLRRIEDKLGIVASDRS
ncbi:MAG: UDP-3-O-(3-hydroxymyristoyl)glucosamine N-acyltransferase [Candidatus Acidiferrales bacterium]